MAYPNASVTTSGVTWSNFAAGGVNGGVSGVLEAWITANKAAHTAPSAATLSTSGSGNTLPSATYYVQVTETDALGETTATQCGSQAITLGGALVVTYASLKTGNTARNVYVGTASDYSDSKLAVSGATGSSTSITAPLPTNSYAVAPPTVNTTGLTYVDANGRTINKPLELLRGFEKGNGQAAYDLLRQVVTDFLRGDPLPFNSTMAKINHVRGTFAALLQVANEIGTLVDANAGTLGSADWGAGLKKAVRTWP